MAVPFSNTKLRVPRGFQNLLEGLSREVLRNQPEDIPQFAATYFDTLLKQRDVGGIDPAEIGAQHEDRFYNNKSFQQPVPSQEETTDQIQASQPGSQSPQQEERRRAEQEEELAAARIQAGFRGYQSRKQAKAMKEQEEQEQPPSAPTDDGPKADGDAPKPQEEVDIDLNDPEVASAAAKIQAGFRGHKVRKEMKKDKPAEEEPAAEAAPAESTEEKPKEPTEEQPKEPAEEKPAEPQKEEEEVDIDLNDPETEKAALKIQAGFKGYKVRKGMTKDKPEAVDDQNKPEATETQPEAPAQPEASEQKEAEERKEEEEIDIDLNDPETEKAAIKIQAGFKGYKIRKGIKQQEDAPKAEEPAEEKAEEKTEEATTNPENEQPAESQEEVVDIDLNDPEVAKAATKIQAGFKGYKARKGLTEKKEDAPAEEEPEKPAEEAKETE